MEAVDLTAARYLHEARSAESTYPVDNSRAIVASSEVDDAAVAVDDEALRAMESMEPLHSLASPLMRKVAVGLSSMAKIVGTSTTPRSVDASGLATVMSVRDGCEADVVGPLRELRGLCGSRMEILRGMLGGQVRQLEALRTAVRSVAENAERAEGATKKARAEGDALADRSDDLLEAAGVLVPASVTAAERSYFAALGRYDASCRKWEDANGEIGRRAGGLCDAAVDRTECRVRLTDEQGDMCRSLLKGQEARLRRGREKLRRAEGDVGELAERAGLGSGEEEDAGGARLS